ncbi:MAG: putative membrane protein YfcA [Hyphomicrobiaceae bacterium]|jgi:uncharacterized membrane protein YfcA
MNIDPAFAGFAVCVAIAFTTDASIGFGSMLLGLTLGAQFYPISTILPWLLCMSVLMTSYMVLRHHEHIEFRLLATRVFPGMGAGMLVGSAIFSNVSEQGLRGFLGCFVIVTAFIELRRMVSAAHGSSRPLSGPVFAAITFAAGIVHGITATSGPVLVYGVGRLGLHKSSFRSTLAVVWLTLNATLAFGFYMRGQLTAADLPTLGALAPIVGVSIVAGEWLHGRFEERTFRFVILAMLLVSGISLLA